jgi:acetylornithine deacetylase/succinyl-diaminopimelate desuccinylase-like protein
MKKFRLLLFNTVFFLGYHTSGFGQALDLSYSPTLQQMVAEMMQKDDQASDLLIELGGIISPSGREHERAEAVARHMKAIGLQQVRVTEAPNVVGYLPGQTDELLVFVATLDDLEGVAEHQKAAKKSPYREEERVIGPGANTSSITVSMLLAAEALKKSGIKPYYTLVFAAVAQEETGLQGMKMLYDTYKDRAVAFVDILGDGRSISYGALGIHWYKVIANGPPGHSLGGGTPNVNQGIGRAVDRILSIPIPETMKERRTIVNVGKIESGNVFNHKPEEGWFSLDIRSLDAESIRFLEEKVDKILEEVGKETATQLRKEAFQITPGGQIPGFSESELVTLARSISLMMGIEPRLSDSGSSNMNIALGNGKPAIGLGGERGGRRGFEDEWADIGAMLRAAVQVMLIGALFGS